MKYISLFSKHFWPENFKINDVCFRLAKNYKIDVYTSYPSYNNLNYIKIKKKTLKYKGLKIRYFKSYIRKKNNALQIFLDYLSHLIALFMKTIFCLNIKSDVTLTFATSPIFQALPAIFYSRIKKIPNIIWVQDLWPEVLEDTGYIKNKFILKIIDILVMYIYSQSDLIITQSESFKKYIKNKYKIKTKIVTLHQPSDYSFQKKNIRKKKTFSITYAGNFGYAQDFDTLIDAYKTNKIDKNILFNFIGSGKKFNYVKNKIKINNLENKIFLMDYKNKKNLFKILKNSSAFFLSLKNGKSLNRTIPGKFQTYISFGKPIIICSNSDLNYFILKNKIGFASKLNQTDKLVNNINKSYKLSNKQKNKIYISSKKIYKNLFEINKVTSELKKYIGLSERIYAKKNIS